jgi:hypothetical protein
MVDVGAAAVASNKQAEDASTNACTLVCTADLRQHIGTEIFLLSCPVVRYNKYGWRNLRTLVLTQDTIVILKQRSKTAQEVRLRIGYDELKGLTISCHADSTEVVCHVQHAADLRMSCHGARKAVIDTIKMFYANKTRDNLPCYGVRQKSLGMYTTQESDVVKGISRKPLNLARLTEEDLVDFALLVRRMSDCFSLPELNEDLLNTAFSSLAL